MSADLGDEIVRDVVRGDERAPITLRVTRTHPWRVEADGPTGPIAAEAGDLFEATARLREQLEPNGWMLQVNGARVDAYPSSMARDSGGRVVYVLHADRAARRDDLVETLAPIEAGRAGTVAEQRESYLRWHDERGRA